MKRLLWIWLGLSWAVWAQPLSVPDHFRGATQSSPLSIGDLKWFEIFEDGSLQSLIEQALASNNDLQIALLRVDAARATLREMGAQEFPQIGATGEVIYTEVSANSPTFVSGFIPRQRTVGQILLNLLSFELDLWGRVRHQTQTAVATLLATQEDQHTVASMVVSEVAADYFNLIGLDAELDIARRTLSTRQSTLKLVRLRQEGGIATLLDTRQAEQLVESAELAVPELESRITQQENNLKLLLGQMPGPIARGQGLLEQKSLPEVPPGLPSELLTRRPDIRAAEQRIAARHEQLLSLRAAYFPRISLTGFLGYQSGALSNLFTSGSRTAGFGPQILLPAFSAGQYADVEVGAADEQVAVVEYRRTVQTAFREVSNALVAYAKIRQARLGQDQLVATLRDRVRLAYLRYQGGVDNLLSALDADRDLFSAELLAAQGRRNELLALVQLYKALGGGWQMKPPTPAPAPEEADPEGP